MYGDFNHLVAAEQIADRHRAAEASQLAASAREPRAREQRESQPRVSRGWLALRRRPKVA